MISLFLVVLRIAVASIALWAITAWRGVDPVSSFPETAIVLLIIGICVMSRGIFYGLSLFVRCVAAVGLIDFCLRLLMSLMPNPADGVVIRFIVTGVAAMAAFMAAWWLDSRAYLRTWDAPLFFGLASLVVAIGTRDSLGMDSTPYVAANVALWLGMGLMVITAFLNWGPLPAIRRIPASENKDDVHHNS